jgi:hypothetical protein
VLVAVLTSVRALLHKVVQLLGQAMLASSASSLIAMWVMHRLTSWQLIRTPSVAWLATSSAS